MPQMSPMWWATIMMWTIICLTMMISINYFNYMINVKINKNFNMKKMYWKW